jgi:hypothetical protein
MQQVEAASTFITVLVFRNESNKMFIFFLFLLSVVVNSIESCAYRSFLELKLCSITIICIIDMPFEKLIIRYIYK